MGIEDFLVDKCMMYEGTESKIKNWVTLFLIDLKYASFKCSFKKHAGLFDYTIQMLFGKS